MCFFFFFFLPVTPGEPGFHLSSAVLQWEKWFLPLICHVWDGNPESICIYALWSAPIKNETQTNWSESIAQKAGAQGVWRVSKGDRWVCSSCKVEGSGAPCQLHCDRMASKGQKLEHRIFRLDVRNVGFFSAMRIVKVWKRGCWCSPQIFKTQLKKALHPDLMCLCLQLRWPPQVPPNPNYSVSMILFSLLKLLPLFSKRSDSFRNGSSCWLYASGGNVNGGAAALLAPW